MSEWQDHDFERKVVEILTDVQYYRPDHQFGRPFITDYQLALECPQRFPADVIRLGLQVGGKGIGARVSLAQYLAGQLSAKIQSGDITNIEGGFLSNQHLRTIVFDNNSQSLESSLTNTQFDLSMFRLLEQA